MAEGHATVTYHETPYKPADLPNLMVGRTVLTFEGGTNRVTYFREDGSAFVWLPGVSHPSKARWFVRDLHDLCTRFTATYHPLTLQRRPDWTCRPIADWETHVIGSVTGDVFRLSTGAQPGPLNARPPYATFDELKPTR